MKKIYLLCLGLSVIDVYASDCSPRNSLFLRKSINDMLSGLRIQAAGGRFLEWCVKFSVQYGPFADLPGSEVHCFIPKSLEQKEIKAYCDRCADQSCRR